MRYFLTSIGLLLIAMFSIQFGATVAKGLFPLAGALGTTALRVFFSAIIVSLISQLWKHKISVKHLPVIAAYGMCLGLMNLLFYLALERIPLGIAVALEFTGPLFVALYLSKRSTDILWIVLAALGLYLLLPIETATSHLDLMGIGLALAAGLFWGLYIVFGKRAAEKGESLHIAAIGMWFASLVTMPVGLWFNGSQVLSISLWPMGILIALLSSAIPYSLEMKAMKRIPAKTFGILMSLEPVIAVFIGFIFLSETLTPIQGGAIALIIAASAGSAASYK